MCGDRQHPADTMCARCQGRWFDVYLTTSEATVSSLSRTLIWYLLDNERSDRALFAKDVDFCLIDNERSHCVLVVSEYDAVYTVCMIGQCLTELKTNLS